MIWKISVKIFESKHRNMITNFVMQNTKIIETFKLLYLSFWHLCNACEDKPMIWLHNGTHKFVSILNTYSKMYSYHLASLQWLIWHLYRRLLHPLQFEKSAQIFCCLFSNDERWASLCYTQNLSLWYIAIPPENTEKYILIDSIESILTG